MMKINEKLKVAIIGLGIVSETHLQAYQSVNSINLVAGADLNKSRLKEMAGKFNFRPYSDYHEMLDKEALDIVCVCTPASTHLDITTHCAQAKVNVLCEKPIALNINEVELMISVCKKNAVKLFYGSTYRFLPALKKARELIADGVLGNIKLLTETLVGGTGLEGHENVDFVHYPKGTPGGGGNGIMDHGIHLLDVFPWLIGNRISSVFGRGNIAGDEPQCEYVLMNFESGAVGHLLYDDTTFSSDLPNEGMFSSGGAWDLHGLSLPGTWHSHPGCIRVYGSKGSLRIFHYTNQLFLFNAEGVKTVSIEDRPMPGNFSMQMEAFAENIINGDGPDVTAQDGLNALNAALATYKSFKHREMISL